MTPAPQTESLIAQLEKARQLWAEAESAKSNKLWQTEEDALRTLQVAMYDFWKPENIRTLLDSYRAAERERDEAHERCAIGVTVGGGLIVYGSGEAIGRVQDYIMLDSKHPIEKEDVRRSLMRDLQAAEARAEAAESALSALEAASSPAPGEPDEATKRRLYADRSILRDELMKGIGKIRVKNTAHVTALRPTLGESLSWSLVRDIADAAIDIQADSSHPTSPPEPPQGVLEALKEMLLHEEPGAEFSDRVQRARAAIANAERSPLPLGDA